MGLWSVYFGCDQKDVSKCCRLVRHQLDRLMEKQLSKAQLLSAKQQIKGQIAIACDNRENFALDFGKSFLHNGKEKDLGQLFRQIDAVTAQDIQHVAQELFVPEHIMTLIYQ
jgi:predicted Zn-dependent peptidase